MVAEPDVPPIASPSQPQCHAQGFRIEALKSLTMPTSRSSWPTEAADRAQELHDCLRLTDRNWHQFKGDADRRAAELLAAALVQLLQGGSQDDACALADQGLRWLKRELKDPGCPHR